MKNRRLKIYFTVLIVLTALSPVTVQGYYSYGARAVGMGGAYTGLANDGSLFYWNPGGLASLRGWVIELQYGQDDMFAENVRPVMDSMNNWFEQGEAGSDSFNNGLMRLADKDWLFRGGDAMSFIVAHRTTAMFFNQKQIYYIQNYDNTADEQSDYSVESDLLYELSGIDLKEYGVTFTILGGDEGFSLGLSGKYIRATGYHSIRDFRDIHSAQPDFLKDMVEKGARESNSFWGLDAGIMMHFGTSRFGITGRNIRKYSIDITDDVTIHVRPEYRMGYAYQPTEKFVFSLDYTSGKEHDILGNKLDGRELASGFEGLFGESKWLILRGGISMPLEGDAPMIISLGTGLSFESGVLDIGYAFDQNRESRKLWFGLRFMFI